MTRQVIKIKMIDSLADRCRNFPDLDLKINPNNQEILRNSDIFGEKWRASLGKSIAS
jgi:hypothetical protein